jgi:hypothetical protein
VSNTEQQMTMIIISTSRHLYRKENCTQQTRVSICPAAPQNHHIPMPNDFHRETNQAQSRHKQAAL